MLAGLACSRARGHGAVTDATPSETEERIDPTKPLCSQLEVAAKAAFDSLFAKFGVVDRRELYDFLPRVDCWAVDEKHRSTLPDVIIDGWAYERRYKYGRDAPRARGIAVLGLIKVGTVDSSAVKFNLVDLVREWRDELVRRGFSPHSQEWDLKLVIVYPDGRGRFVT
ncbi:MAG: hypothetical protein WBN38_18855, partial [Polyangiales bacterium]